MKQFPEIESKFNRLIDIFYSAVSSRLLISAVEIGLFDYLEEPVNSAKVADALSLNPENTMHVLDALCALDLVKKDAGLYQNQIIASEFLIKGKSAYIGNWFLNAEKDLKPCLDNFTEIVRFGPKAISVPEHMNSSECCEKFTDDHAATSFAGIAHDIARNVSALPSFKGCRKMLDMGGGPGVNAMAVVMKNQNLNATVFDRPDIVKIADGYIKEYGFSDRIKTLGGNYLKDNIGSEYDMIMITDSLYYTDFEIDAVLNKCRAALTPEGFFVGIHAVLTEERTRPANLVMGMLPETVMNSGTLPDKGYLIGALKRCGFKNIESKMITIGDSLMEMNVGYLT